MTNSNFLPIYCAILHFFANFCGSMEINEIEKKLAVIDSTMKLSQDVLKIPGIAVGIIVDGQVVSTKGYGVLDNTNKKPVTPRSLFAVGSITKAFTTFLLGLLVDEGRLNWDDPVIKHIPEFRLSDDYRTYHVTVRDLVSHRTGQPRHDNVWTYASFPRDELLKQIPYLRPNRELREKYQYTNLMYIVAGIVAERVAGQSWENLIRNRIFAPLGFKRSTCSIRDPRELEEVATPYTVRDGKVVSVPWVDMTIGGPAGSVVSNVEEMTKWAQVHLRVNGQNLIQNETLDEIHTIQIPLRNTPKAGTLLFGYGLGWATAFYRGRYQLSHNGEVDGFTALIAILPEEKIGIVILVNSDSHNNVFRPQVVNRMFDVLLDVSVPSSQEWVTSIAKQEEQLSELVKPENNTSDYIDRPTQFVGEFFDPGYGRMEISANGSQLYAFYNTRYFSLKPKIGRSDVFEAKWAILNEKYECSFVRDRWGDVSACRFDFEDTLPPILFEKKIPREFQDPEYLKKFIGSYQNSALSVTIRMNKKNRLISSSGELKPALKRNIFYLEGSLISYYEFIVSDDGSVSMLKVHDVQKGSFFNLKRISM